MKLTELAAIDLSIEFWTWIHENGKQKEGWPGWAWNGGPHSYVSQLCFLCEYAESIDTQLCPACIYVEVYGRKCTASGEPFRLWDLTESCDVCMERYSKDILDRLSHLRHVAVKRFVQSKMNLPEAKEAVRLSIKLWEWLAETGLLKYEWPEWKTNGGQYDEQFYHCFMCTYDSDLNSEYCIGERCAYCPYYQHYGIRCYDPTQPYSRWEDPLADATGHIPINYVEKNRKMFAAQFLRQLKEVYRSI